MILLIDDLRTPEQLGLPADTIVARTSEAGIDMFWEAYGCCDSSIPWDEIWLDHDLGPDDDIWPVISEMERGVQYGEMLAKKVYVHSQNPVGKARMIQALRASGYEVEAR
jgi:hypothetical protein